MVDRKNVTPLSEDTDRRSDASYFREMGIVAAELALIAEADPTGWSDDPEHYYLWRKLSGYLARIYRRNRFSATWRDHPAHRRAL